jgi:hypothetical protein
MAGSGVFGIGKGGNEILIDLGRVIVPDEVVIFPARIPTEDSGGFPPGLVAEISEDTSHSQAIRLGRWVGTRPNRPTGFHSSASAALSRRGSRQKEIADRPNLRVHTVDSYFRRIHQMLHVNTLGGAVAKA